MNLLELERETAKMTKAIATCHRAIGQDTIADLRNRMSLDDAVGVILVSLERLLWFDPDLVCWAIEHLIPSDMMQEIQSMTQIAIYQRLIRKGLMPGIDFSIDDRGQLLLNQKAQKAVA